MTNFTGTGISGPNGITVGPDGALWFTNTGNDSIGRITTTGAVSNFPGTGICNPNGIVSGPDGNIWFTNDCPVGWIGRITPTGVVTYFGSKDLGYPKQITVGPGGALWFTTPNDMVWRITTAGVLTGFDGSSKCAGCAGRARRCDLVHGVHDRAGVTGVGVFTIFSVPDRYNPFLMTKGSDGAMWFTNFGGGESGGTPPR